MDEKRFQNIFEQRKRAATEERNKSIIPRSAEVRHRHAIDHFTREIKDHAHNQGREMTETQARSEAMKISERARARSGD